MQALTSLSMSALPSVVDHDPLDDGLDLNPKDSIAIAFQALETTLELHKFKSSRNRVGKLLKASKQATQEANEKFAEILQRRMVFQEVIERLPGMLKKKERMEKLQKIKQAEVDLMIERHERDPSHMFH